jgi:hypothetical protein
VPGSDQAEFLHDVEAIEIDTLRHDAIVDDAEEADVRFQPNSEGAPGLPVLGEHFFARTLPRVALP